MHFGDLPQAEGARLRVERRRLALLVAIGDLAGRFDLTRVTRLLSDFADDAIDRAIRSVIRERTPDAEPRGFAAIALGKLGSRELNYSSDVDPILIFDRATLPCRPREAPEDAAVRIGRRVVDLLQARDGDGYVFRVDLRLRPSPEATPIALPVEAAISYYESQALPWERAAFIRARACAGDVALGEGFLAAIRPFVWRRALDFGMIREIRDISRRIRDHHAQGQAFGPGFDLKRGRGGIREIEFFAQIHQLIHGGRDPALRVPATRDALASLAGAGWIDGDDARAPGRGLYPASARSSTARRWSTMSRPIACPPCRRRSTMSRNSTGSPTARRCSTCCVRTSRASAGCMTGSPASRASRCRPTPNGSATGLRRRGSRIPPARSG